MKFTPSREPDSVRKKLNNGVPMNGAIFTMRESIVYELLGIAGCDFVWTDNEYPVIERYHILDHIIFAHFGGTASFVGIVWNEQYFS